MKFMVLVDFTDKARQNPPSMEEMATKIEHRYWGTGGAHDIVVVLDAPDGDTVAKLVTKAQMAGLAVPKVMHVWSDEERAQIVKAAAG